MAWTSFWGYCERLHLWSLSQPNSRVRWNRWKFSWAGNKLGVQSWFVKHIGQQMEKYPSLYKKTGLSGSTGGLPSWDKGHKEFEQNIPNSDIITGDSQHLRNLGEAKIIELTSLNRTNLLSCQTCSYIHTSYLLNIKASSTALKPYIIRQCTPRHRRRVIETVPSKPHDRVTSSFASKFIVELLNMGINTFILFPI